MRDLEIRGAGNLLGARQHGHIEEAVGYDLYCKMLNEAVKRLKGEKVENDEFETNIDLKMDAFIPADYIPNELQKTGCVTSASRKSRTEPERDDMVDELIDRFGEPPQSVCNLLEIALLTSKGTRCVYYGDRGKGEPDTDHDVSAGQSGDGQNSRPACGIPRQTALLLLETTPYFVYQQKEEPLLRQLSELVNEMQKIKEEENE